MRITFFKPSQTELQGICGKNASINTITLYGVQVTIKASKITLSIFAAFDSLRRSLAAKRIFWFSFISFDRMLAPVLPPMVIVKKEGII
ncbi:hypothetical protein T4E_10764 [Trichinella pseudospiralis]|uniref:Uncharacterized protein n=1 Tax=Trichinella pseudospiralis TaxID=6337 RepID=A0A0V0XJP4_TRIPS|nr:hypothetical protein T4E_10764 [Trichinella pseudospiralis]